MGWLKRAVLGALWGLAACGQGQNLLEEPPVPLGDFRLGHTVVVTKDAQKIPPTREATPEEWQEALRHQITRRFGRYEGGKFYNIAVKLEGYSLAVPGVPVVLAPKSAVVASVTIWDDAAGRKLNAKPHRLTVFEGLNGETVIGTGLTRSREAQMQALSFNTARMIERWLVRNRAEWFTDATPQTALQAQAAPDVN